MVAIFQDWNIFKLYFSLIFRSKMDPFKLMEDTVSFHLVTVEQTKGMTSIVVTAIIT